jgi:hypothetical protein
MDYGAAGRVRVMWMAPPVVTVSHTEKAESFWSFVARVGIGVIVLDGRLPGDERFGRDREFMALWDGTDTGAFVIRSAPGGARIAVRRDLLAGD